MHVVLYSITEDILAIVRSIVSKHGKGCIVEVLDVDVEVSVLNLC